MLTVYFWCSEFCPLWIRIAQRGFVTLTILVTSSYETKETLVFYVARSIWQIEILSFFCWHLNKSITYKIWIMAECTILQATPRKKNRSKDQSTQPNLLEWHMFNLFSAREIIRYHFYLPVSNQKVWFLQVSPHAPLPKTSEFCCPNAPHLTNNCFPFFHDTTHEELICLTCQYIKMSA